MNHSEMNNRILSYLAEHPDAEDTVEGIVEWWLLDRTIKFETARVQQALAELVVHGFILKEEGRGAGTRYRLNQSRRQEIQKLINH